MSVVLEIKVTRCSCNKILHVRTLLKDKIIKCNAFRIDISFVSVVVRTFVFERIIEIILYPNKIDQ